MDEDEDSTARVGGKRRTRHETRFRLESHPGIEPKVRLPDLSRLIQVRTEANDQRILEFENDPGKTLEIGINAVKTFSSIGVANRRFVILLESLTYKI